MCYLISVSAIGFDGSLPKHFHAYKLLARPTRNPTVLRALAGVPYDITDGHCYRDARAWVRRLVRHRTVFPGCVVPRTLLRLAIGEDRPAPGAARLRQCLRHRRTVAIEG